MCAASAQVGGERAHATDAIRTAVGTLVTLTVVTGLVDAVSYLALGHVFVANMTGNVVFLGFALAGAPAGLSALAALAAFLVAHWPAVASPSGPASTEGASYGRR